MFGDEPCHEAFVNAMDVELYAICGLSDRLVKMCAGPESFSDGSSGSIEYVLSFNKHK